jgi:hypothetical protein
MSCKGCKEKKNSILICKCGHTLMNSSGIINYFLASGKIYCQKCNHEYDHDLILKLRKENRHIQL